MEELKILLNILEKVSNGDPSNFDKKEFNKLIKNGVNQALK